MRIQLGIPLTTKEIIKFTGSFSKLPDNLSFSHICTDSREAKNGDLFFAFYGEKISGEEFVKNAKDNGAFAIGSLSKDADFICDSTENAILKLAEAYKTKLKYLKNTIAITGSVGKTTTKEFCASFLEVKYKVHKTYMNFNNALGVALSLLSAPPNTEILVLELGMNHIGEIEKLSEAVKPNYSIITNIGSSHIGNLGSRELIAKAKLEILCGMEKDCLLCPYEEELIAPRAQYTFSLENKNADFRLIKNNNSLAYDFFYMNTKLISIKTPIFARHHLKALLSALSLAYLFGLESDTMISGCERCKNVDLRQKFIDLKRFTLFDDTYSSSPEAVKADLEFLEAAYPNREKSCILGDMLELGAKTEDLHKHIGKLAYDFGCRYLYAFGVYAPLIKEGAHSAGIPAENIFVNTDITSPEITAKTVCENAEDNEVILIKASHALHAERILKEIERIENNYA